MKAHKIRKILSTLLCLCVVLQTGSLTVLAARGCDHTFDCEYYYGVEDGHYAECDECGACFEDTLEDHVNEDNDDWCDLCDYYVGHEHTFDEEYYHGEDEGHYAVCDQCDFYLEDTLEDHVNEDNDDWCDLCDYYVEHEHVFDEEYYYGVKDGHYPVCDQCDYYLEDTLEDHVNEDNDDWCDLCDYYVGHEHTFDDEYYYGVEDGHYPVCDNCDYYLEDSLEEHVNELGDHYCDVCDYCLSDDHVYSGSFYYVTKVGHYVRCDMCEEYDEASFGAHIDMNADEYCDECKSFINYIYIVLEWGDIPSDLDSHLIYSGSNGSGEIAYYSMELYGTNVKLIADLDVDDTDYFGPEVVTIYEINPGDSFRYYVHDYSNGGNPASGEMAKSGATVKVYKGTALLATYHVPTDMRGYIWEVFSYSDDGMTELEHEYTETRVDASVCGEYGYFEYYCENCGDRYEVYDEAPMGHLPGEAVIENKVSPDCENEGCYDVITYCTVCGEELSFDTVIAPALGHSYRDGSCINCGKADPDVPKEIIIGDLNSDGFVNAKDINIIIRVVSGSASPNEIQKIAGDVNNDGKVNAIDANLVTRIAAGGI